MQMVTQHLSLKLDFVSVDHRIAETIIDVRFLATDEFEIDK